MVQDDYIQQLPFSEVNLDDPFFDSLKYSYLGFDEWFSRKATGGESAYFAFDSHNNLIAMLYLKEESGLEEGVTPRMDFPRLKIGTFKVDFDHHTGIGKRLLAIALREFAKSGQNFLYVTMHDNENTSSLAKLLYKYGFSFWGSKDQETVLYKTRPCSDDDTFSRYPFVSRSLGNCWILSIRPEYHKKLFGDVHLTSESGQPKIDERCLNSIEKIYLSGSQSAADMVEGDKVIIYRTTDYEGPAHYRSVVTSVCTVVKVVNLNFFRDEEDFLKKVRGKTVYTLEELRCFWQTKRYPWLICLLFNFPLERYPNRKQLLDCGFIDDGRLVCERTSQDAMDGIMALGNADESFIVD
ncbi:hypothetical protein DXB86_05550 [Collinsella sp. OM06-18AC]|uniref:hypothetical protein n=1 Tax=Collinsella sp. OM06-18AC TaxID=2292327 RepID=UPI000E432988|nr:hypothetical protein [Collinsella sp. OM06-18AC]RGM93987.1 hypothetical protein DXB86_05550 [Collinsella sp. OM06-18AC]